MEIRIGWPLPSMSALESVVEAIATNTSVTRLDIREGDTNLIPDGPVMSEQTWWYGKDKQIADLIVSGLERNQSITEIHIKGDVICDVIVMDIIVTDVLMQFV